MRPRTSSFARMFAVNEHAMVAQPVIQADAFG